MTTSAGRLFDAVAALCGIRAEVNYEGQAAVELEAAADRAERGAYPLPVVDEDTGPLVLDARATVRAVVADLEAGAAPRARRRPLPQLDRGGRRRTRARSRPSAGACGAWSFRAACSRTASCSPARPRCSTDAGLRVLTPERLPPNDGGIAYGQLAVAAARIPSRGDAVFGLDESLAALGEARRSRSCCSVALLLGLRHATDPDHLAAVSTLIASDTDDGARRAGRLGLAWGLGHAVTLAMFGLPIVLWHAYLPEWPPAGRRRCSSA